MDVVEVEAKTYEEAVRKASIELNAEEKDLDIDVKEIDTKGILGLLGTRKIRITARLRSEPEEAVVVPEEYADTPEEYGKKFLVELLRFYNVEATMVIRKQNDRILFAMESGDEEVITGQDGEVLEALQHLVRLAIAKRYKQNLKLLLDVNGFRERRKKTIIVMAKRLADKVRKGGKPVKTKPLNPYERRIVHTLFKNNHHITTQSEGDGHTKKVIISPSGPPRRRMVRGRID
jgi:spoIIIJ-associated protein